MNKKTKINRIGEERLNYQGCLMKIVKYNNANDIIAEFQDEYKAMIHSSYCHFINGRIKNPYYPSVYGVGIIGMKYPKSVNNERITKPTKEYTAWSDMLKRCYDEKYKKRKPTYKDVTCCSKWLNYENFYEWLHSQENFDKWLNNDKWVLDKDILVKNNKTYSPETCCLVHNNINLIFTKKHSCRGALPIGVTTTSYNKNYFSSNYNNNGVSIHIGVYDTPEKAFQEYKMFKEKYIKQVAQEEYNNGNITKKCYDAMMRYEVEITD